MSASVPGDKPQAGATLPEVPLPKPPQVETPQLVVRAAEQLRNGELPTARALLERAAREFGAQGDTVRQGWCTQVAGSLARYQARRADADCATVTPVDAALSVHEARATALRDRDAAGYLTAAVAEALLADSTGDRVGAYRSLAMAWVTLGDLIGPAAAEHLVAPQLLNWRRHWGADAFASAKAGYQAQAKGDVGG